MEHLAFSFNSFVAVALFAMLFLSGCMSSTPPNDAVNVDGTAGPGAPIAPPPGVESAKKDKQATDALFNQIPGGMGDDTEISMPADSIPGVEKKSSLEQRRREWQAKKTDNELVGSAHATDDRHSKTLGDLDKQLGVQPEEKPGGIPSYTLGIQFVKELFQDKKYEDALIEANELLHYYPKSAQLLLMKGTLHQRLGQIDLALTAYQRSAEYEPSRKLQAQIDHVQRLINERETLRKRREGIVAPGGEAEIRTLPGRSNEGHE